MAATLPVTQRRNFGNTTLTSHSLKELGWNNHFQSQLTADELELQPARVLAVHRDALEIASHNFEGRTGPSAPNDEGEQTATVGDWVLVDQARERVQRVLERRSLFKRKRAGTGRGVQLIAANVDTLLIATSANHEFNAARLERYLALAIEAAVSPLILLTKADLADDVSTFLSEARSLYPGIVAEAMDARDPACFSKLSSWFGKGQTLALVGSSGVGKSTIVNTMLGNNELQTHDVRHHDSHGRHTTTGRFMHALPSGAWLIDTPGMRELQIMDAQTGVTEIFADIVDLQSQCKFSDCTHENEPGCAVRDALESGSIGSDRLKRYRKLQREVRRNSDSIAQAHKRSQKFGQMQKRVITEKLGRRER